MMGRTHLGLFEGIGGFSLAARRAGYRTVAWCEWNEFGQRVLRYHFPEAEGHGDIRNVNFNKYYGSITLLTGGFPCQPFSQAGKRKGSDDERFLWPETLRALKEVAPPIAIFENVLGLTSILESACESEVELQAVKLFSEGDDSENVEERLREVKQRTLSIIINDLYQAGYILPETVDGTPIVLCIPACAVNAPHRRDRIWIVAYAKSNGDRGKLRRLESQNGCQWKSEECRENNNKSWNNGEKRFTTDTDSHGCNGGNGGNEEHPSERGFDALSDIEQGIKHGDATNANSPSTEHTVQTGGNEPTSQNEHAIADAGNKGLERSQKFGGTGSVGAERNKQPSGRIPSDWQDFPTQSPVRDGNDGISERLDLTAISESKWRNESIKAGGNAIVHQVALELLLNLEETVKALSDDKEK